MEEVMNEAIRRLIINNTDEYSRILEDVKREIRVHGGILR